MTVPKTIIALITAILIIAPILATALHHQEPNIAQPNQHPLKHLNLKAIARITPELRIYKIVNGKKILVYDKKGDPPTYNFWALIAYLLGGTPNATIRSVGGATTFCGTPGGDTLTSYDVICVGTGVGTPSPSDTDLFSKLECATLINSQNVAIENTSTTFKIYLRAIFSFSSTYNISEVGLYVNAPTNLPETNLPSRDNFLLFHDVLSNPIPVNSSTILAIEYVISIKKVSPIVNHLVALISDIIFGTARAGYKQFSYKYPILCRGVKASIGFTSSYVSWNYVYPTVSLASAVGSLLTRCFVNSTGVECRYYASPVSNISFYGLVIFLDYQYGYYYYYLNWYLSCCQEENISILFIPLSTSSIAINPTKYIEIVVDIKLG